MKQAEQKVWSGKEPLITFSETATVRKKTSQMASGQTGHGLLESATMRTIVMSHATPPISGHCKGHRLNLKC